MAKKEIKSTRQIFKPKTKRDFLEVINFIKDPILLCGLGDTSFLSHYWQIEDKSNINIKIILPGCFMSWNEYAKSKDVRQEKYWNKFEKLKQKYNKWMKEVFNTNYSEKLC